MTTLTCPRCGSALSQARALGLCPRCLLEAAGAQASQPEVVVTHHESRRPNAPTIEQLAPFFPGLQLDSLIAVGGMGAVYKATQTSLGRTVALKILHGEIASEPGFSERFQREARTMATLSHPGLVAVHDFGQAGPYFHFVMEFVDGVNLRQMLRAKTLTPEIALRIVPQICEVLQYAHDRGVVHRDIKPENILVERGGRVKVLDFGLSKMVGKDPDRPALTRTDQVMGTPHYMAPEQWERPLTVDHRADIYSLGVVFYELLTGELPLGRFAPPSRIVHIDVRLDEVVLRTLDKEPMLRYQQASELKSDVEHISATEAAPIPADPVSGEPAPAPEIRAPSHHAHAIKPGPPVATTPQPGERSARKTVRGAERLPGLMISLIVFYGLSLIVMILLLLNMW